MAIKLASACLIFMYLMQQLIQDVIWHVNAKTFPFQNTSLPWDERVDDLVGRLTLDELVLQVSRGGVSSNGPAPAIERLGILPYQWNTECLRGDVEAGNATSFPQALGLSAMFR